MRRQVAGLIPQDKKISRFVEFGGGVDLRTAAIKMPPGRLLSAMNYEPYEGYTRIDGYERYDGRTSPSSGTYALAQATFSGSPAVGDTITGGSSGATGVIAAFSTTTIVLTKVTGTFIAENFTGAGGGTLTTAPVYRGATTALLDATYLNAAADIYRADIQAVPGSGSVLGVWAYNGNVYAFRNNAGGTAAIMHKATTSGWTAITFGEEVYFTLGTDTVNDGDTLTQGVVTATIARVVQQTTVGSPNRVGKLIITGRSGGNFAAGLASATGGVNNLTLSGAQTAITLTPSGRYEFENYNFAGDTAGFRMYGCDGLNRAFEFDGTTYVPIDSGLPSTDDKPTYLRCHRNMLFFARSSRLVNSGVGKPYIWTASLGAADTGMGESITGLAKEGGDVLMIFGRNSTHQLLGSSSLNFTMQVVAPEQGAAPYTVQSIGNAIAMDDRGVTMYARAQEYGNFEYETITRAAQKLINDIRANVTASSVYRGRNQYRLYSSTGSVCNGVIVGIAEGKLLGVMPFQYPVYVTAVSSCEDSTGKDVVFFGSSNGYVYQADKGSSFDGEEIEAYIRPHYNNLGEPSRKKRFRDIFLEMTATNFAAITCIPDFAYGDADIDDHDPLEETINGAGGIYNVSAWEAFNYDARLVETPHFKIDGTAINIVPVFYSKSDIDLGHRLQGYRVRYSPRKEIK